MSQTPSQPAPATYQPPQVTDLGEWQVRTLLYTVPIRPPSDGGIGNGLGNIVFENPFGGRQ